MKCNLIRKRRRDAIEVTSLLSFGRKRLDEIGAERRAKLQAADSLRAAAIESYHGAEECRLPRDVDQNSRTVTCFWRSGDGAVLLLISAFMGRIYTRIHRLLRLVAAIQSNRGLDAADLAHRCEVHERTIYRDIDTLNASGVPCSYDAETRGYRVAPGFFMPPVELTFEEAMAIVALLEEVGDGAQIPFLGAAARAAEKLRSQLPATVLDSFEPIDDHVHIDLARSSADDSCRDVYDDIRNAVASRRIVRCTYESANHASGSDCDALFDLRPYALWFCQRAWYVVGHHSGHGEIRRLKLNRFTSIKITDRPFAIPEDFDLHADLGLAWRMIRGEKRHRVAVRFGREFADSASETRWHPTQEEEWDHHAGTVTLRFTVDGLEEIVWWVLGYGPGTLVLEPPELVEKVRNLAKATAEQYARP